MRGLLLVLLSTLPAAAAPTASLLDEGVGARVMAMGGAGVASVDDATALYWNPARLSALKDHEREAVVAHAELSEGRAQYAGYAQQADDSWGGVGALYRDRPGRPAGDFETSDFALMMGYAKRENEGTAGLSAKYLRSRVPGASAHSFAADLGVANSDEGRTTALALRNMGPGLKYGRFKKDLPLTAAMGFGYKAGEVAMGLDYEYRPFTGAHDAGAGVEWEFFKGFLARGGWTTKDEKAPRLVVSRGFTFGGGIRLAGLRLDYAFRPKAGRFHRFDAAYRF
ncbi:MAG: PorV/PorQ family protein [Elusimicrobiota bacterium]|nr:PorV/PorQ family protein [Elusimicrobiota bacterium]